jgi:1,4-alpha-glucan branching enzyme
MKSAKKKNVGLIISKSGVSFRVWAPNASSVNIIGTFNGWQETPMNNEMDGYWHFHSKIAKIGQEYKYVIYNGNQRYVRNDPRSLHFTTTQGSSVIAGNYFDWGDDSYTPPEINKQVIYELHVGTFNREDLSINGNFQSVTDKLDYLKDLGITTIELMPISTMIMDRGWGYGIDYIFAIESLYGGLYGFKKFVKAAHSKGIGVIVDVVYNHFGPDESLDLWQYDGWKQDNYGGIYFYNDWRAETPWGNTRPDYGRPEVNQYILDNIRMLLHDCRVDGLRVDSTIYMRNVKGRDNDPDNDLVDGWEILQKINKVAKSINPRSLIIGEDVGGNEYITKPINEGGSGFDCQWEVSLPQIFKDTLMTSKTSDINLSNLIDMISRKHNNLAFQRILYIDSHDSAANGSSYFSETISKNKASSLFVKKQSLIAAVILLTCLGVPMIFQGQEFLQPGSFSDWEGLDWSLNIKNRHIKEAFKKLISLRKDEFNNSSGLIGEIFNVQQFDDNNKVIAYHRQSNKFPKNDVLVIINFGDCDLKSYSFNVPKNGQWSNLFYSTNQEFIPESGKIMNELYIADNGNLTLDIPASTAIIIANNS